MADKTGIEWTRGDDGTPGATWNPIVGCSRVSSGCDHCYAMGQAHRIQAMGTTDAYDGTTRKSKDGVDWTGVVRCLPERLNQPLRWKRPRRIFVNSMSDLFHPSVPFDYVDRVFAVMADAWQHTYQVLTKRPERMAEYLADTERRSRITKLIQDVANGYLRDVGLTPKGKIDISWPLSNVWLGTSVENQQTADERIPHLLRCPAVVRWLSCEPLLGPIDLASVVVPYSNACEWCGGFVDDRHDCYSPRLGVDWIVIGGESGPKARPMDVEWASQIIGADIGPCCFFMKQGSSNNWDAYKDFERFPPHLQVREYPA